MSPVIVLPRAAEPLLSCLEKGLTVHGDFHDDAANAGCDHVCCLLLENDGNHDRRAE